MQLNKKQIIMKQQGNRAGLNKTHTPVKVPCDWQVDDVVILGIRHQPALREPQPESQYGLPEYRPMVLRYEESFAYNLERR